MVHAPRQSNFKLIITISLLVRITIALSTRTFFQPDEYFQALEPAHHLVFGYGDLTWEWLNPVPIRSILFPGIDAVVYAALKALNLDGRDALLISGPKIIHGALASLTDIGVCRLTQKVLGDRYVYTALLVSCSSFFHAMSLSRAFSNSLETSLTVVALSFYPWNSLSTSEERRSVRTMLCFAAVACAIRPTNAVIWVYVMSFLLYTCQKRLFSIILDTLLVLIPALLGVFALDSWYYRRLTFTPLNFLLTNLSNVSSFYGMNTWHYYLSQAIPILCTTALPFTAYGMRTPLANRRAYKMLVGLLVWTLAIYSLAKHKEWRFIHPLLPIMHLFAARGLVDLSGLRKTQQSMLPPLKRSHLTLLLATLPICAYVVTMYCSGPISVMHYLLAVPPAELVSGGVGFLMPCHSTPGQAYLHRPEAVGRVWALGCEPPLGDEVDLRTYQDQTDIFFSNPLQYLDRKSVV